MANGFVPTAQLPEVDLSGFANQMWKEQQQRVEYQKQQDRKTALMGLMSGGDDVAKDPTKYIMGYLTKTGDEQGAMGLAQIAKAIRPPQLTPDAILRHQDFQTGLTERQNASAQSAKTPQQRLYEWEYPASPATTDQTATQDSQPSQPSRPTPAEFVAQQKVKQVPPEAIQGHYNAVNQQLSAMNDTIQDILKDPELDYVVGRGSIGARFSLAGSPYRTTASKLDQLENQAKLYGTVQLRESSKTGSSGFGRLTNTEFGTFGDLFANLRRGQDADTYRQNLIKLSKHISESQANMKAQLEKDLSGSRGGSTGVPGMQPIETPPPDGVAPQQASAPMPSDPRQMNDKQILDLAKSLAQNQKMNKQQIIDWFDAHGVKLEP